MIQASCGTRIFMRLQSLITSEFRRLSLRKCLIVLIFEYGGSCSWSCRGFEVTSISMDSHQSVVSPFKGAGEFDKRNSNLFVETAGCLSRGNGVHRKESTMSDLGEILGVLEVYVHQATKIHNICIYHKQDVYAKVCLTSDPENAISTKIITGGGQNPVFNDSVQLNVRTIESSLKCEIWMLSRVKNYLEDQLLGFALVPLPEVLVNNGKLEKEFSLSSTELFHSPAGFVRLSLTYEGVSPDVYAISAPAAYAHLQDMEEIASVPSQFDKIEFPDPNIVNENRLMVSEYFGIPCPSSDSHSFFDPETQINQEVGAKIVESFSNCRNNSVEVPQVDSPPSSVSTNGSSSVLIDMNTRSSDTLNSFGSASCLEGNTKEKNANTGDAESNASEVLSGNTFNEPLASVTFEPEPKVKQQDFVDMYMKSMQEFTESLEQLKLPLDISSGPTSSGNSSSNRKSETTPKNSGSKVFYGSRAFF